MQFATTSAVDSCYKDERAKDLFSALGLALPSELASNCPE
jgi:hypothetical protein